MIELLGVLGFVYRRGIWISTLKGGSSPIYQRGGGGLIQVMVGMHFGIASKTHTLFSVSHHIINTL